MKNQLKKWEPLGELNREIGNFRNRMMGLFERGNGGGESLWDGVGSLAAWEPAVDISEDDKEYVIKADLPDIAKDQVKVTMDDGRLTIQGERKHEEEEKKKKYHRIERSYGRCVRSFLVPGEVDGKKIEAKFKDGVLTVRLPKSKEKQGKEHEIEIK